MTTHRRRQQRQRQEHHRSWFLRLALFGALLTLVAATVSTIFFRPWRVTCVTTQNTYCSDTTEQRVQQLQQTSFWKVPQKSQQITQELLLSDSTLASIDIQRRWYGTVHVVITKAEALFPVRHRNQDYQVRANGSLTPLSAPMVPIVLLEDPTALSTEEPPTLLYDRQDRENMAFLYAELQTLSPNIQKIIVYEKSKIEIFPEGRGSIYVRLGTEEELQRQLNTLQAIFHSTTMETDYQTLDIRFRDVIMK
ncbi:hypothetical protein LRY65_05945 [Candidatus Woesebacteria bacterium]|nr:hypothetical protein [Candidatus Woesebacteria bacterium]MCD8506793.1 hypothetical protein [Candidatus Woesebacteria bacterium]MCD8527702.1 hypothetical protein [Candidatus Woesebacteria bacterium]MCD8546329.1 hypothetical protein [Candidatus Woesebacteria bacterium]